MGLASDTPTKVWTMRSPEKKCWAKMDVQLGKDPKGYFPNQLYSQKPPSLGFG